MAKRKAKKKSLKTKKKCFLYREPSESIYQCNPTIDVDSVKEYLSGVVGFDNVWIHTCSFTEQVWKPHLKARTILSGIKRGHTSLALWQYVNRFSIDRYGNADYTKMIKDYDGLVIDIDNHPTCSDLESLEKWMIDANIPIPRQVIQTSEKSFHFVYLAEWGFWNKQTKSVLVSKILQKDYIIDIDKPTSEEYDDIVDFGYLRQDHKKHKFRVPGSVNYLPGEDHYFVCKLWDNPDYDHTKPFDSKKPIEVECLDTIIEESVAEDIPKGYWDDYRDRIRAMIAPVISSNSIEFWTDLITSNLTFIKNNEFNIPQEIVSEKAGVSQMTISRQIKILKDTGVLSEIKGHIFTGKRGEGKAKTYGAGRKISELFNKKKNTGKDKVEIVYITGKKVFKSATYYDLSKEYLSGETYDHMLRDIRYLFLQGFSEKETCDFVFHKLRFKKKRHKRRYVDIVKAYRNWSDIFYSGKLKSNAVRSNKPSFTLDQYYKVC